MAVDITADSVITVPFGGASAPAEQYATAAVAGDGDIALLSAQRLAASGRAAARPARDLT